MYTNYLISPNIFDKLTDTFHRRNFPRGGDYRGKTSFPWNSFPPNRFDPTILFSLRKRTKFSKVSRGKRISISRDELQVARFGRRGRYLFTPARTSWISFEAFIIFQRLRIDVLFDSRWEFELKWSVMAAAYWVCNLWPCFDISRMGWNNSWNYVASSMP